MSNNGTSDDLSSEALAAVCTWCEMIYRRRHAGNMITFNSDWSKEKAGKFEGLFCSGGCFEEWTTEQACLYHGRMESDLDTIKEERDLLLTQLQQATDSSAANGLKVLELRAEIERRKEDRRDLLLMKAEGVNLSVSEAYARESKDGGTE